MALSINAWAKFRSFREKYGDPDLIVRAPGRANIIGEHVDYCGGTVMPFAIQQSMYFFFSKVNAGNEYIYLDCDADSEHSDGSGLLKKLEAVLLKHQIELGNFRVAITSDIPIGGGLSSSSALCCGFIYGLNELFQKDLDKTDIIRYASAAEYGVGVKGGLMDQHAVVFSKANKALYLDCNDHSFGYLDLDPELFQFELWDTGIRHKLMESKYNNRRETLELAMEELSMHKGRKLDYNEVKPEDLSVLKDPVYRLRIRHVISERKRVTEAKRAIETKDIKVLAQQLNASHESLRDNYEVSWKEADWLQAKLIEHGFSLGSRMVGGGFGGHLICLRNKNAAHDEQELLCAYKRQFGIEATKREVRASSGIGLIRSAELL